MKIINKPNFIIIGAMKAATTSLYTYLKQHPEIFMPSVKEPMFFNNIMKNDEFIYGNKTRNIKSFTQYWDLFKSVKNEKAIGEASPAYIYNPYCAKLIKKHLGNVKIIAILRQPTERAYSNYLHARRSGREPIDKFKKALEEEKIRKQNNWSSLYHYKSQGYYYKQLSNYYKSFDKENIKVILFEDLITKPDEMVKKILKFLKVDSEIKIDTSKKTNISGIPKGLIGWIIMKARYYNLMPNIQLSKYLSKYLMNIIFNNIYQKPKKIKKEILFSITNKYYKKDILKLEKLINKNLKHWLC